MVNNIQVSHELRLVDALGGLGGEGDALGVLLLLVNVLVVLGNVNGLAVGDTLVLEGVLGHQVVLLSRELDAATFPLDEEGALHNPKDPYTQMSFQTLFCYY